MQELRTTGEVGVLQPKRHDGKEVLDEAQPTLTDQNGVKSHEEISKELRSVTHEASESVMIALESSTSRSAPLDTVF